MLVVGDVQASARFYATVLGAAATHGGDEYEQIAGGGELVLQLHALDVEHHHGPMAAAEAPRRNGFVAWFEVDDLDAAVRRARDAGGDVERDVHENPNAKQQELWLRDPDGYLVVLAGPSPYRPRGSR